MKIIREGPEEPWSYELTCFDCNSVLEVAAEDIKFYGGSDYPISRPQSYWVRCPVCKAQPDVPLMAIPPATKRQARDAWYARNP